MSSRLAAGVLLGGTLAFAGAFGHALPDTAAAATAKRRSGPRIHRDRRGDAKHGIDLTAGRVVQRGPDLVVSLAAARPFGPRRLKHDDLCLLLWQAGASGRACVVGYGHPRRTQLRYRRRPHGRGHARGAATFSRKRYRALNFRVPFAKLGLRPGRFGWRLQTLGDRLPQRRHARIRMRLRQAVPTGCTPRSGFYTSGPAKGRRIALTFDDGPWYDTADFVKVLRREHAPATFFLIGRQVSAYAGLLRQMVKDGFILGDHTWDHADIGAGGSLAASEISRTQRAVRAASGFTPCLLRPPYGSSSSALVSQAGSMGLATIEWNADPRDWARPGSGAIYSRLLAQARPGGILLMHDGGGDRSETLAQLPSLIHTLRARHYKLVTIPQLLGFPLVYGRG